MLSFPLTVTRRSRNLGYAWSTTPTGKGTEIEKPAKPQVVGSVSAIEAEVKSMHRATSGGVFHRQVLWVGEIEVNPYPMRIPQFLAYIREHGSDTVLPAVPLYYADRSPTGQAVAVQMMAGEAFIRGTRLFLTAEQALIEAHYIWNIDFGSNRQPGSPRPGRRPKAVATT